MSLTAEQALNELFHTRQELLQRIETLSNRDLADFESYPWLQGRPLWQWIAEGSFEHEAEHTLQIQVWRQRRGL